jgi:hypothetical protein
MRFKEMYLGWHSGKLSQENEKWGHPLKGFRQEKKIFTGAMIFMFSPSCDATSLPYCHCLRSIHLP